MLSLETKSRKSDKLSPIGKKRTLSILLNTDIHIKRDVSKQRRLQGTLMSSSYFNDKGES